MGEGEIMATGTLVALTAVSAGMSIVQGFQQSAASTEAGKAYLRQAQIAAAENELAVQQKQREIDKTAAQQVMAMAKNGVVTSVGSPLEVLYETAMLGKQEVEALKLSGNATVDYYGSLSSQQFNSGRNSILGGFTSAVSTIGSAYMVGNANNLFSSTGTKAVSKTTGLVGDFSTASYSGLATA